MSMNQDPYQPQRQQPPEGTWQPQSSPFNQPPPMPKQPWQGPPPQPFPPPQPPQGYQQQAYPYPYPPQQPYFPPMVNTVVNVNTPQAGHGFFIRALYFLFIPRAEFASRRHSIAT